MAKDGDKDGGKRVPDDRAGGGRGARKARLGAALKENLRRRKAQSRARAARRKTSGESGKPRD